MVTLQESTRSDGVTFKVEDVVKVIKRPKPDQVNHLVDTLGFMGFIEEFREVNGFWYIQLNCLDGHGMGAIPIECIEHDSRPASLQAKRDYDEDLERRVREAQQSSEQRAAQTEYVKQRIAERFALSPGLVGDLIQQWEKMKP